MNDTQRQPDRWVNQMLEEHDELRAMLGSARIFLENPRPDPGETGSRRWAKGMSEQLDRLHGGLSRHFHEEERDGEFMELARRYPRASDRVELFQSQHRSLIGDLEILLGEVRAYATGGSTDDPRLRRRLVDVLDRVDAHERGETELLQRMLYNDIGEGD